jgi:hypothetical protein
MATRKKYSKEFKQDAVSLVADQGYSRAEASRSLDSSRIPFLFFFNFSETSLPNVLDDMS